MKRKLSGSSSPDFCYGQCAEGDGAQSSASLDLEQSVEASGARGFVLPPHLAQLLGVRPGSTISRSMFYGTPQAFAVSVLVNQLLDDYDSILSRELELGEGTSSSAARSGGSDDIFSFLIQIEETAQALMDSIEVPPFTAPVPAEAVGGVGTVRCATQREVDLSSELGINPSGELLQVQQDVLSETMQLTNVDYCDDSDSSIEPDRCLVQSLVESIVASDECTAREEVPATEGVLPAEVVVPPDVVTEEAGSKNQVESEVSSVALGKISVRILGNVTLSVDVIRTGGLKECEEKKKGRKKSKSEIAKSLASKQRKLERRRVMRELEQRNMEVGLAKERKIMEKERIKLEKERARLYAEQKERQRKLLMLKIRKERQIARMENEMAKIREKEKARADKLEVSIREGLAELQREEVEQERKREEKMNREAALSLIKYEEYKAAKMEKEARAKARAAEKAARAEARVAQKAAIDRVKEQKEARARANEAARDMSSMEATIEEVVRAAAEGR